MNSVVSNRSLLTSLLSLAAITTGASAVALTDPGFENFSTPLLSAPATLTNFVVSQNQWGQENSSIVSNTIGPVSPFAGNYHLKMDTTGGVTTQAFQALDVSSYSAAINANIATVSAGAWYNSNARAAIGGVYVSFLATPDLSNPTGPLALSVFTLDNSPNSWELNQFTNVPIPAGTNWILFQVAFDEASLLDASGAVGSGYVDNAYCEIIPAPSGAALLAASGLFVARRRR